MTSTHVRIQKEVKDRLTNMSREGESINSLLTRLMDYYDGVTIYGNDTLPLVNSELTDRLTELENRVSLLESVDRERVSGNPEDQIVITEDMLSQIHEKMTALKDAGVTINEISEKTGIAEGSLKKLMPAHSTPLKRIVRKQYEELTVL